LALSGGVPAAAWLCRGFNGRGGCRAVGTWRVRSRRPCLLPGPGASRRRGAARCPAAPSGSAGEV